MNKLWVMVAMMLAVACRADVQMHPVFGDNMVLQRDKPVAVFGTAAPGEKVAVTFNGQTASATADAAGSWLVKLVPMQANASGQPMTVSGTNKITIKDVLVGDVWLCSGQSNMDMRLGGCNRKEDIDSADFPAIRQFALQTMSSEFPLKTPAGKPEWRACNPKTANQFSGTAFYFARKIWRENNEQIPEGLILAAVGGTRIDRWLAPDGLYDIPVLQPLIGQNPLNSGTFSLFNGMIAPLAPYGIKGAIWYQGENSEVAVQSPDSYYLKMKGLAQGWKRVWGMDDFAFYFVMLANYGELLKTETPVLKSGGWDADTRLQQANAMALPHAGCASAMDIGISKVSWAGYHPQNKLDVGERLALWALKNDYGRPGLVASGPVLRDVSVSGSHVVCHFDYVGKGLMVGAKKWYEPVQEVPDGKLQRFVIAGADGKWCAADAVIKDDTVILSSAKVPAPRKISYACWQNPEGSNLYNKDGLPAAPFYVEDVTIHHGISVTAGEGGDISPSGTRQFLQRMTALYTISPKPGFFIQDVEIDGVSVGSVKSFTFDPIYKNHTISATFSKKAPSYMIAITSVGGGAISPSSAVMVPQGGSLVISTAPETGKLAYLTIDGVTIGHRNGFTFSDVRANHTLAVSFSCAIEAAAK